MRKTLRNGATAQLLHRSISRELAYSGAMQQQLVWQIAVHALAMLAILASVPGCSEPREDPLVLSEGATEELLAATLAVSTAFAPLPLQVEVDPARAALGERMFADPRLSGDQRVSCAGCHMVTRGGANGETRSSLAAREKPVAMNVPSIFNLAFDFRYAWDGRFATLEQQIDFAMSSPAAMAGSFTAAATRLFEDRVLVRSFVAAYPEGLTAASLRDALTVYCRSAITPNARFDRFLRGELQLSEQERRGYESFRDYGCVSCHQGVNLGGNMYQRLGVMRPYYTSERPASKADLGRYNITLEERDKYVFRVPSLRNVARTAPYFHDGSAATLEDAVGKMARYQLGRELAPSRTHELVAFLRTLTGEYHGAPL